MSPPAPFLILLLSYLHDVILSLTTSPIYVFIQALKPAALLFKQAMWLAVLDQRTLVHHDNFVKVEDGVESVCDGNNGMGREPLAEQTLYNEIGCGVKTNQG